MLSFSGGGLSGGFPAGLAWHIFSFKVYLCNSPGLILAVLALSGVLPKSVSSMKLAHLEEGRGRAGTQALMNYHLKSRCKTCFYT